MARKEDPLRKGYLIFGPYLRKDGRQHVVLRNSEDKRVTVSYPKWLMEQHLGRILGPDETVDHVDRDFTNNDISNLQILERSEHVSLDNPRAVPVKENCVWCGLEIEFLPGNRDVGKAGPFCSKVCSGKYGAEVQFGRMGALPAQSYKDRRQYIYLEKKKSG